MPLYDYLCDKCGPLREWRGISEASKTISCPNCGGKARRVITAPSLALMAATTRAAHARNERSANEPMVVRREQLSGTPIRHLHNH